MGKLNIANINSGLNKVKSITEALANVSHFENVPAELIHQAVNNPYATNDTDESLHDLAMSIQTNGLINPLAVNKVSDASYTLISGERRYSAITKYLDMKTIPCMVYENISQNAAQLKLHIANLDVREYTTAQKLQFYQDTDRLLHDMKESGEYTGAIQQGIAELLGVSDRQVRKYKTITDNLSAEQQKQVINGELSINDACKIAQQSEETKSGTGSAFDNPESAPQQPIYSESAEPARKYQNGNKVYYIKQDEPGQFSAYFKIGDSEELRLGTLPIPFPTFNQAQAALNEMAASRGYEEIPADEPEPEEETGTSSGYEITDTPNDDQEIDQLQDESKSGTGSGFCEDDYDHEFWDDKIKFAIKHRYNQNDTYLFYLFNVPTTQEAIKDLLKPQYSGGGGTIIFPSLPNDIWGFGKYNIANMELEADTINGTSHNRENITLSYSKVDSLIREMIRGGEWLSKAEERTALEEHMKGH